MYVPLYSWLCNAIIAKGSLISLFLSFLCNVTFSDIEAYINLWLILWYWFYIRYSRQNRYRCVPGNPLILHHFLSGGITGDVSTKESRGKNFVTHVLLHSTHLKYQYKTSKKRKKRDREREGQRGADSVRGREKRGQARKREEREQESERA